MRTVVKNATGPIALGFTLDSTFAKSFNSPQYKLDQANGVTLSLNGFGGSDTLTGDPTAGTALFGNGGRDTLITSQVRTVMFGDDVFTPGATSTSDTYKITSNLPHLIVGLDVNDKIRIKPGTKSLDNKGKISQISLSPDDLRAVKVDIVGFQDYIGKKYLYLKVNMGDHDDDNNANTITPKIIFYIQNPVSVSLPVYVEPADKKTPDEIAKLKAAHNTAFKAALDNEVKIITSRLRANVSMND